MPPLSHVTGEEGGEPATEPPVAPRFGDWVWRPWYAKVWWGLTVGYWTGAFAAQWLPSLRPVFQNDQFPIIFLVLHPFTIFPVLGFGFARAWMSYCDALVLCEVKGDEIATPMPELFPWSASNLNPWNPRSTLNPSHPNSPYQRMRELRKHQGTL